MEWTAKRKAIVAGVALALLAGAYGAGRWSAPTKETIKVEERVVTATLYATHSQFATSERKSGSGTKLKVTKPDGTVIESTGWEWRKEVNSTFTSEAISLATQDSAKSTEKVIERDAPRLTLLGTVGADLTNPTKLVLGGQVAYRVAGPLALSLAFDSSLRLTVGAGLSF